MNNNIQRRKNKSLGCVSSIDNKKIINILRNNTFKFIRNDGQLDNEVMYYTKTGMSSFFFAKDRIVFSFLRNNGLEQDIESAEFGRFSTIPSPRERTFERLVYTMRFSGSSPDVVIEGQDECSDTVNYFKGNNSNRWCTNIPCFERIIYKNLYPSIDLACRFNDGNLKYDFIVNPGAALKDINITCSGIDGIEIDSAGNLVMKTPMGDFIDGRPDAFQEIDEMQIDLGAEFALRRKTQNEFTFGFRMVGRPNPNYPIVIDPEIVYSSYLGGSLLDSGNGIAVDENGCVYVTGGTYSPDFPTMNGYDPSYNGEEDVFITKISRIPSIVYSTYLGGSNSESAGGIAVDKMGNIIVTGFTFSSDFPMVNAFDNQLNGRLDAFVTKFSPFGDIVYSSYLGGSEIDSGDSVAVDESGNAYVAGDTRSSDFPVFNAFQPNYGGNIDGFITKISPSGTIIYSSFLGGNNLDIAFAVAVDINGNAYVTGETFSINFPLVNAFDNTLNPQGDAFITKISPSGVIVYSSYLGGSDRDLGAGVAVDRNGNAYITGLTSSMDFPLVNAFQNNFGGGREDAFITKVSPVPAIVYSSFLGGNGSDLGNSIAVDQFGSAYITGGTMSTNFPTRDAFDNTLNGPEDAFITKISPSGAAIEYSSYLGGSSFDDGFGVAVDRGGNAYVTGFTASTDFPVKNAFQRMPGGEEDAFVVKIEAVGQRPECILTYKVFDSLKKRECSDVFIPAPDKDCSSYTLTGMKFENGIIDYKTLIITSISTSPDYKNVRFMFRVPCISKYRDYHTGKVIEKASFLSDIWFKGVLYMPEGREELKFDIVIETFSKLLGKPQKVHGGYKVRVGLFYVVKSTAKVQLEVISNGYCIPLEDCSIPGKDKCSYFLDPAATPFPTLYPRQQ